MSEAITHKLPLKHELAKHIADVLISSPADGQVLTYEAASQKWKNKAPPGAEVFYKCRLYRTVNQSIPNATMTFVEWDAEDFDDYGMHDPAIPQTITIKQAGKYLTFGQAYFAINATGRRAIRLRKNAVILGAVIQMAVTGDYTAMIGCSFADYAVNDTIDMIVYQNSGAALDLIGGYQGSSISVFRLP